ncbi:uncharacterized protein V6R79_023020 [Siganus canaliculatus]
MHSRRSSRLPKTSKSSPEGSPILEDEPVHRKLKGKKQKAGLRKTKADHRVHSPDAGRESDIISIIDNSHDAVAKEDDVVVEVRDNGLDDSDEDKLSVTSSVASGPSQLHSGFLEKLKPNRHICSACQKLCQTAKRTKKPLKDKLLDNDPKSLTCDQWVLMKKWRPRLRNIGGEDGLSPRRMNILNHLHRVQKRLQAKKNKAKQTKQLVQEEEKPTCSRPHIFLHRNLRCVRVPVKKERKSKKRKRKSGGSQGPRVTKLQRLHGNVSHQQNASSRTDDTSLHGSVHDLESCSNHSMDGDAESPDQTTEAFPSKQKKDPSKHHVPKRAGGFRELLAQLRGNNSMIVREKQ